MEYSYEQVKYHEKYPAKIMLQNKPHRRCNTGTHWHKCMEFLYIVDGRLGVKKGQDNYVIHTGEIFFANSEEMHATYQISPEENVKYLVVLMSLDYLKKYCDNLDTISFDLDHTQNNEFVTEYIKSSLISIASIFESKQESYELFIYYELLKIYTILLKYCKVNKKNIFSTQNNKNFIYAKKAIEYIGTNYKEKITLGEVSGYVGLSESYFARYFKQTTKSTFVQYVNIVRLEHSLSDIINHNKSVTQASYENGFSDVKAFIEMCKKIYHCTPKQYKHKYLKS